MRKYNAMISTNKIGGWMNINIGQLFTMYDFTSDEIETIVDMPIGATLKFNNLTVERVLDAPDKKNCPTCGQAFPKE